MKFIAESFGQNEAAEASILKLILMKKYFNLRGFRIYSVFFSVKESLLDTKNLIHFY